MNLIEKEINNIDFESLLKTDGLNARQKKLFVLKNNKLFIQGDIVKETDSEYTLPMLLIYYMARLGSPLHESIIDDFNISLSYVKVIPKKHLQLIFGEILKAPNVKPALEYIFNSPILKMLIGEMNVFKLSSYIKKDYLEMAENLHRINTNFNVDILYAVFFRRFNTKMIKEGIHLFKFKPDLEENIVRSLVEVDKIFFLNTGYELKKYIVKNGFDTYNFFHNIAKAEKIIFDRTEHKTEARIHLLTEINNNGEPYLVSHLNISDDSLIKNGICENELEIENTKELLLEVVIKYPRKNTEKALLVEAKKLRNPLRKYINKVMWRK